MREHCGPLQWVSYQALLQSSASDPAISSSPECPFLSMTHMRLLLGGPPQHASMLAVNTKGGGQAHQLSLP